MQKTIDYYMALPYTIELQYDSEDAWFVRVKELPGCMSQGDTPEEAMEMIREAMELWLEVALEDGDPIPEPRELDDYSGKFVVRLPRSLHRDLVQEAVEEGVSLNQYISVALARSVGRPVAAAPSASEEPCWSMLKDGVRRALLAAGLAEEAGELDEQLFADHANRLLEQVEAAINGGYFREATWAVGTLAHALKPAVQKSPVLAAFARAVDLLSSQLEMYAKLQQGVVNELIVQSRIGEVIRTSSPARRVAQETDARYDALFQGTVRVVNESDVEVSKSPKGLSTGHAPAPEW
jgi:antitoxin HicB